MTPEQHEARKARARARYAANPGKYRQAQSAYREANRDHYNAQARARRAGPKGDHIRALRRDWRARNLDKVRAAEQAVVRDREVDYFTAIRRQHGLSREDYQAMWDAQGGRCYLCGGDLNGGKRRPAIEHDHKCCPKNRSCPQCRRGLACGPCNLIVGHAKDDPDRLRLIAVNLEAALA